MTKWRRSGCWARAQQHYRQLATYRSQQGHARIWSDIFSVFRSGQSRQITRLGTQRQHNGNSHRAAARAGGILAGPHLRRRTRPGVYQNQECIGRRPRARVAAAGRRWCSARVTAGGRRVAAPAHDVTAAGQHATTVLSPRSQHCTDAQYATRIVHRGSAASHLDVIIVTNSS